MKLAKKAARAALQINEAVAGFLLRPVLYRDWLKPQHVGMNERPAEYAFALDALMAAAPDTVLDVGPGTSSWPHLLSNCGFRTTAIDKVEGYWTGLYANRHYRVVRDDVTRPAVKGPFDAVTCLSVLEHIPDHAAAVRGMLALLRPGGTLVLTFPYSETRYVEDVYRVPGASYGADYPFICRMYSRAQVDEWLAASPGAVVVEQRWWEAFTGDMWAHGERLRPPRPTTREGRHHLTGIAIRKAG